MNHQSKWRSDCTTKKNTGGGGDEHDMSKTEPGLATNEIKELLTRPPLWESALTHRMMAPLWLLIGFQTATDHIVTGTDGITKVTDHFVMEKREWEEDLFIPLQNVCVLFRVKDKGCKLQIGGEGIWALRMITRLPNNSWSARGHYVFCLSG